MSARQERTVKTAESTTPEEFGPYIVYERLGKTDEALAGFSASQEHDDPSLAPWMRERVERRLAASAEAEERFAPAALRYLPGRRKRR